MTMTDMRLARWQQDLVHSALTTPLLVLENNILDVFRFPLKNANIPEGAMVNLEEYLHYAFRAAGYDQVITFEQDGFRNHLEPACCESFAQMLGLSVVNGVIPAAFHSSRPASAPELIYRALTQREQSSVIIVKDASHLTSNARRPELHEANSLATLLRAAQSAASVMKNGVTRLNLCILLVQKASDIPDWCYHNNPFIKTIFIPLPGMNVRSDFLKSNFAQFFNRDIYNQQMPYYAEHPDKLERIQNKFVAVTDGMLLLELEKIRKLNKHLQRGINNLADTAALYQFGVTENPWKQLKPELLTNGYSSLVTRVKGQHSALEKTLDVVRRAQVGLNGLQHSSHSKPKGVLFYAGPTGVGKTETAKALAELIFGDESACIRFDMSEYSQPHSDQKLMGAPPGYVGYEAGGQLTNAIKRNPFAILLFDEIEKAHPSILDKFLQILEDGRLTDGQGNTYYFSECVIIFTSNLGMTASDEQGNRYPNITAEMDYPEIELRIKQAISEYFRNTLGRPEILNRIGENIVVFDFIREDVAQTILCSQLARICKSVEENNHITLQIDPQVSEFLLRQTDLSNGGRGIGSVIESLLLNPLARYLCDHPDSHAITIRQILIEDGLANLVIS